MKILFVAFDFDGIFTNGKCFFDSNNNIIKYYNIKDGMALSLLKKNNIKIGLISSYSTEKNILLNEQKINENIQQHLKFDFCFIGAENKINVLNKWIDELNIDYKNVAYIGDDINDIEIMNKVGFSACPNDAVIECKNSANYVCKNNGGEGCVREFVNILINNKTNIIQEIKNEANYQLNNFSLKDINDISELIKNCNGITYFMGIGKSGNMAKHICDLLKSLSINTFYLDTINILHGDIGTISKNDIVIMFSKSGNTKELVELIPYIKEKKCNIIGVCCDKKSLFKQHCDVTIEIPFLNEIDGNINKIPTNSCMSQLLFGNLLVSNLKKHTSTDEYKINHPAGNIGNNLKKIKDCIILNFPKIILEKSVNLHDVLLEMTKYKIGCCFFVNCNDELLGILTDGDIRRLLLNDDVKFITILEINTNFYYEENINKYMNQCKNFAFIPILQNKIIVGIISKNIFSV